MVYNQMDDISERGTGMEKKLNRKFWAALVVFSLTGQVAWVVENMYFNVFIYKMFHAGAAQISLMVGASAVSAAMTTLFIGALSDKIGKRKLFICLGYIIWGISILSFAFIRTDILTPAAGSMSAAMSLGAGFVVLMDCVMTFFGSSANDACFNAWLTEKGDASNRGRIEGINAMMPLVAILVVFGSFMGFDLDRADSWTMIYVIIGTVVTVVGLAGFVLIDESNVKSDRKRSYFSNIIYSFRPSVIKENEVLYLVLLCFIIFGISIQIFMPYLILYYELALGLNNYVLIMAPAIILAAAVTAFYGKLYDRFGFFWACLPMMVMLMGGYVYLFLYKKTYIVFIGSFLMMSGYLTGMAVFGAMIRDHTPGDKAGLFQGVRIFAQVLIPGIIGPAIGAAILKNAEKVTNSDGTESFIPNRFIFLGALAAAAFLTVMLFVIHAVIGAEHAELYTVYGEELLKKGRGEIPLSDYPRPQLKRDSYFCLNGEWEMALTGKGGFTRKILVPFAPQSLLSGYGHFPVPPVFSCRRKFTLPAGFVKDRTLLHFGAVDQVAVVYLNGSRLTKHRGGYLPFTVDITDELREGENEISVTVEDMLSHIYPYGKQRIDHGGMWYTPVSGIWQTVWIESVPEKYIRNIRVTSSVSGADIEIFTDAPDAAVSIHTPEGTVELKSSLSDKMDRHIIHADFERPENWTPENPYLYEFTVTAGKDRAESYFALRTVEVKEVDGRQRICLNGSPYFFNGVLDQGYFSDGIYTPASYDAFRDDIAAMKKLGFNMLRKHIKVEPDIYYYLCDKLGMAVFQDMVNSGHYSFIRDTLMTNFVKLVEKRDTHRPGLPERKKFFVMHCEDTLDILYDHPCIVYYTIFNEGWGQFDSDRIYTLLKQKDPTRIYDSTSGWFAQEKSDVLSLHVYYQKITIPKSVKPIVLSECGGYSCKIPGHSYSIHNNYGYGNAAGIKGYGKSVRNIYTKEILPLITEGLCASVYTQLSDVEDETNGFLTYDRKVCKIRNQAE